MEVFVSLRQLASYAGSPPALRTSHHEKASKASPSEAAHQTPPTAISTLEFDVDGSQLVCTVGNMFGRDQGSGRTEIKTCTRFTREGPQERGVPMKADDAQGLRNAVARFFGATSEVAILQMGHEDVEQGILNLIFSKSGGTPSGKLSVNVQADCDLTTIANAVRPGQQRSGRPRLIEICPNISAIFSADGLSLRAGWEVADGYALTQTLGLTNRNDRLDVLLTLGSATFALVDLNEDPPAAPAMPEAPIEFEAFAPRDLQPPSRRLRTRTPLRIKRAEGSPK